MAVRARDAAGNVSAWSRSVSATMLSAATTGYVSGFVLSAASGAPINGAKVSILVGGRSVSVTTSSTGFYLLSHLPPGSYTATVLASGYQTQCIPVAVVANLATITVV